MFENLSQRLTKIFDGLRHRGSLSEDDVRTAMREVRVALLEADVALPVVKDIIKDITTEAIGKEVLESITPGQQVIKIVHDHLVKLLGGEAQALTLQATPPVVIYMVGLQGAGKTTTAAKLALYLKEKQGKSVYMASTDIYRPAAREQLAQWGTQIDVPTLPIEAASKPLDIVKAGYKEAKLSGADVYIVDTAGRLHIDQDMMDEVKSLEKAVPGTEILLTADALTGQDAVNVATHFQEHLKLTGIILTRMDGDSRGGAALSMASVTGCPVKFSGTGETVDGFEVFHPDRVANRILGMGDVVTLVEKAAASIDEEEAKKMAQQMQSGTFTLDMMKAQLEKMSSMGGLGSMMNLIPGLGKMQDQLSQAGVDDKMVAKQIAIICSMTKKEKVYPKVLNGSRKKRIAAGSGTSVMEVNRLLKQFRDMETMMKRMKKMGKKGMMMQHLKDLFMPGPK